jgi:shikimate dehydrogenase
MMQAEQRGIRAAVIGWPLGHSISPAFQQAAFDALEMDVTYRAVPVPPENLDAFVASLRHPADGGPRWLGVNVTIPHKQAVAALVDEVTEEARLIGAVNTVICRGDRLVGHNTDATGFLQGMRDVGVDPAGMGAIVLGAGGAARAVAVALLSSGAATVAIANRTPERAESLVWGLQEAFPLASIAPLPLDAGVLRARLATATLLVNTTSVGMSGGPDPDGSPVPIDALRSRHVVYDLVYNPRMTPLLVGAKAASATVVEGLPMLVHQGAASFERWTGVAAPVSTMFEAALKAIAVRPTFSAQ